MRKLRLLSIFSLAIIFIASSCTKEGPEGPAGVAGAQGPAGAPGAPGAPGAGQTTYSAWFSTVEADWVDSYEPPYWAAFAFTKAAPGVTQAIMDNGIVLSYMKNWTFFGNTGPEKAGNRVVQLPNQVDVDFGDMYDFLAPAPGSLIYLYKSGLAWGAADIAGTSFRYVLIPGSIPGGRGENGVATYGGYTREELLAMPYEKVASIFNIPPTGSNIE